jgi:hypothetical protein
MRAAWALLACLVGPAGGPGPGAELETPTRLESGGKPIDVLGGHAAPCVADFDGDGVRDLLVGQFVGEGSNPFQAAMRCYRNAGTDRSPRFEGFAYLDGGGSRAWVPTG